MIVIRVALLLIAVVESSQKGITFVLDDSKQKS